ncbi:hypothetical protein DL769_002038 [Monosporascus sp. CRB-8-3]|nr:hypothetical protein DL769_002038 [Monosporascus sp. CRB-8-3]
MQRAFAEGADPAQVAPFPEPDSDSCGEASMFDAGHFSTSLEANSGLITSPALQINRDLDYQAWQATDPFTKVGYVLKLFKNLHGAFAHDNCAPHTHLYLYMDHMPQYILQAFSPIVSPTPKRQLGKNGPLVDQIGYGTMGLSMAYGELMSNEKRLSVLDHAHKIGQTFWDTGGFYSERMGVDYIDLWYPHRLDGSTPIEHIVAEIVKIKEYIGLSEVSAETASAGPTLFILSVP